MTVATPASKGRVFAFLSVWIVSAQTRHYLLGVFSYDTETARALCMKAELTPDRSREVLRQRDSSRFRLSPHAPNTGGPLPWRPCLCIVKREDSSLCAHPPRLHLVSSPFNFMPVLPANASSTASVSLPEVGRPPGSRPARAPNLFASSVTPWIASTRRPSCSGSPGARSGPTQRSADGRSPHFAHSVCPSSCATCEKPTPSSVIASAVGAERSSSTPSS